MKPKDKELDKNINEPVIQKREAKLDVSTQDTVHEALFIDLTFRNGDGKFWIEFPIQVVQDSFAARGCFINNRIYCSGETETENDTESDLFELIELNDMIA